MKLDIHTHILPGSLPDLNEKFGYPGWISIKPCQDDSNFANMWKGDQFFRKIEKNSWCLKTRCCDMVKTEVDTQVLSTVPVMFNYWAQPQHTNELCQILNNDMATQTLNFRNQSENERSGKSFYSFGTLPMQAPQLACEEMTRCVKDLGFKGIQIGTHINEWNLDAKELYPIWKRAEELDCSIFVHPWDMDHISRTTKYWLPWLVGMPAETTTAICSLIMGNVLTQFPKLRFCFAHGGGAFPFTVGRIQHGYECRPDLCAVECKTSPKEFLGKFWTDSLVHDQRALDLLVDVIGQVYF